MEENVNDIAVPPVVGESFTPGDSAPLINETTKTDQVLDAGKLIEQVKATSEKENAGQQKLVIPEEENIEPENLDSYSDIKRYDSTIKVGERYFDNRYEDFYTIESITPFGESDVEVTQKFDKGTVRKEKGSFILYHIDKKCNIS